MTGPFRDEGEPDRKRIVRLAAALALLGATGLGAAGLFRAALALTLGAAVAIVAALWLSDLVGRLSAPRPGAPARIDWKFGLKTVLRYALGGLVVWGAVRGMPDEVPWLLGGLSVVVAAFVVEGLREFRREARSRRNDLKRATQG